MVRAVKLAFIIRLRSAQGKEAEVEQLVRRCLRLAQAQPTTLSWFGMRLDSATFAIFSAFQNQADLDEHLACQLELVLEAATFQILAGPAIVEQIEIIDAKI